MRTLHNSRHRQLSHRLPGSRNNCLWGGSTLNAPSGSRRAAAAVEFAVLLPLILTITFATTEICQIIFLRQKAMLAAHEGARLAIRKSTTTDQARTAVMDYLTLRRIDTSELSTNDIQFNPSPESAAKLTPITVTVRIPIAGNTLMPPAAYRFVTDSTRVTGEVIMYKEYSLN
ncbi:MAG: TadE/TadG family type IV pilus assembly protein [Planctomycetaceae bacterium]